MSLSFEWWSRLRDEARTRLWPAPVFALVVALALGIALPRLDRAVDDQLPAALTGYLFGGGADAARTVLSAIATSLITVTSLTFSLTVVTLQLASSQYSPRLLRTFTRDRFVHGTLALFLGAFVYALTVLRTVRAPHEGRTAFVPQLSVTVAFALAVCAVLALVFFLAHLARQIRVETILREVHGGASQTIERVLGGRRPGAATPPEPPAGAETVRLFAPSSGFLVAVDPERLVHAARATGAIICIDRHVGDAVVEGTPLGRAWSRSPTRQLSVSDRGQLQDSLSKALKTGFERTGQHDVGFGLRQLTDVAVKALSPGINDPTTAVHALNHSADVLCDVLRRKPDPFALHVDEGSVCVVLRGPGFADLLDLGLTQPLIYGSGDPFVMRAVLELLGAAAWTVSRPEDRLVISGQLDRVRSTIDGARLDAPHREGLRALGDEVATALAVAGEPS